MPLKKGKSKKEVIKRGEERREGQARQGRKRREGLLNG